MLAFNVGGVFVQNDPPCRGAHDGVEHKLVVGHQLVRGERAQAIQEQRRGALQVPPQVQIEGESWNRLAHILASSAETKRSQSLEQPGTLSEKFAACSM